MAPIRFLRSARPFQLILALGLGLSLPLGVRAEESADQEVELETAEEKALTAFVTKLAAAKKELYLEDMRGEIEKLELALNLDQAQIDTLQALLVEAVEATMESWDQKAFDWLAPYVDNSQNAIREIARWPVAQIAQSPGVKNVTPPEEQPLWVRQLELTLSTEQSQQWTRLKEEAKAAEEQKLKDFIEFASEAQRPQLEAVMDDELLEVVELLRLEDPLADKLRATTQMAVSQTQAAWRKEALTQMREMDRARRATLIDRGHGLAVEAEIRPQDQPAWIEALELHLSPDQRDQLESARQARLERRLTGFSGSLLLVLDKALALSVAQRDRLRPLMRPAAEHMQESLRRYFNIDVNLVAEALHEIDRASLEAVLTDSQRPGLERLLNPSVATVAKAGDDETEDVAVPENPEELQVLLTESLIERYDQQVTQQRRILETVIDDLRRNAQVSETRLKRLRLAAKGAVLDATREWRRQLDRWLRGAVQNVSADQIHDRMRTLGEARFGNEIDPQTTPLWQDSLEREVVGEERARWEKELARRAEHRRRVQGQLVISELEQLLALNEEQVRQVEGGLQPILLDYSKDMDGFMSRPWFLQSYSLLMPVVGIPHETLEAWLSPAQYARWQEKGLNQVQHYWDSVVRKHETRMKEEAKEG